MQDRLHQVPPEIAGVLDDLRSRIRRYVLIEGISAVVVIVCALFWLTFSLDSIYFQISKLELPVWFRSACSLLLIVVLCAAVAVWILMRILRGFRTRALALILEKRFPQLGDRLITAVELTDPADPRQRDLGGAMLARTVEEAAGQVRDFDLSEVFDPSPLRRWGIGAAVLLISVLGFGVLNAQAMERWVNAFVLFQDDYWEPYRKSTLSVHVVVQPGDRIKEFSESGVYKHPRGADLTLLAQSPPDRNSPEEVTLSYRSRGSGGATRGSVAMSPVDERHFRHTLSRVIDEHQLWVMGGDYVNRRPYRIVIVDPPRIDEIVLKCDYPDYTGFDALSDRDLKVQGTQVSIPLETAFVLQAAANKSLVGVQIRCEHFDLKFGHSGDGKDDATLTIHPPPPEADEEPAKARVIQLAGGTASEWFGPERKSFHVPMVLSSSASASLAELTDGGVPEIPLPPDTLLQISLHDEDDVTAAEPGVLTINGIVDAEPIVDVRRTGVGTSLTRLAEVPVEGRITDDYGVAEARFGYRVDEAEEYTEVPLETKPNGQRDFILGPEEGPRVERFPLTPLRLKVGQRLALTVFAEDADNLNGPNTAHGEVFSFTIVTPEELLAQLYDKELNLRQRFEQIRREVQGVRDDIALHRQRYEEGQSLAENSSDASAQASLDEEWRQLLIAVAASADRSLHQVRKTHTESRAVEVGFRDIRAEMVNNGVDATTALLRIDTGILQPLHEVNEVIYPVVDQRVGLFRLANETGTDPRAAMDDSLAELDRLLARMDDVIEQMQDRRGYNELIQLLQDLIDRQAELNDATREEQERRLFDLLK